MREVDAARGAERLRKVTEFDLDCVFSTRSPTWLLPKAIPDYVDIDFTPIIAEPEWIEPELIEPMPAESLGGLLEAEEPELPLTMPVTLPVMTIEPEPPARPPSRRSCNKWLWLKTRRTPSFQRW